jgi:hypothetical protein
MKDHEQLGIKDETFIRLNEIIIKHAQSSSESIKNELGDIAMNLLALLDTELNKREEDPKPHIVHGFLCTWSTQTARFLCAEMFALFIMLLRLKDEKPLEEALRIFKNSIDSELTIENFKKYLTLNSSAEN